MYLKTVLYMVLRNQLANKPDILLSLAHDLFRPMFIEPIIAMDSGSTSQIPFKSKNSENATGTRLYGNSVTPMACNQQKNVNIKIY